ncbi:MAG: VOC family protein [Anaerolineales bacterium]|nr:VOC family protein [Anaerolineales bacterium]
MTRQKIVPHLWYDKEAKEAAEFYVSVFGGNSKITSASMIPDTPSGDAEMVTFILRGQEFMAISAGPYFKFNPSISFFVNFDPSHDRDARKSLDAAWNKLLEGGKVLMPLQEYPFSKRYGWIQDKYGLSWQLILTNPEGEERPEILPSFLFTGEKFGFAKEALDFYLSVFHDSQKGAFVLYEEEQAPGVEKAVMFADFRLLNLWSAAMDGPGEHDFSFNEAVSFVVSCDTQEEIDSYWEKLSAVPEAEQCGWCKDRFGVSWQIVPTVLNEMMSGSPEQRTRVTQAFLKMKKFDIETLKLAYNKG